MFNMFKHEDSVIFDPIWCSVIGSDIQIYRRTQETVLGRV